MTRARILLDHGSLTARGILGDLRKYNPDQARDPGGEGGGQWTAGPAGALKDALKLAGKIDLAPNEKLLASSKVDGDSGIRMALTEGEGRRALRLGIGGEGYGQRDREAGIAAWDGNPSRPPLSATERDRLNAELDALNQEWDSATPRRQSEIDARTDELHEQLVSDDIGFNGTAKLDEHGMRRLADRIRPALDEAVAEAKREAKAWDEIEALDAKGNPDPARMAELRRIARADNTDTITFVEGIVPGADWGDVHFSVELDELDPIIGLGVWPKGVPDDWGDGKDWRGQFDSAETRRFLRLLDQYSSAATSRSRNPKEELMPHVPASRAAKPHGDVQYADPGLQTDGKARYPVDSASHVRAAWSYINQAASAGMYTAEQLAQIKARITAAAERLGVQITADRTSEAVDWLMRVHERFNDQHTPAGSATGGQFAAGGGSGGGPAKKAAAAAGKAAVKAAHHTGNRPAQPPRKPDDGTLSYDPNSNHGTGYNSRTGDSRVHTLQQSLNRLGIKDAAGKELKDDGKLGPKTTSAVKALQTRLGVKADGKVTPALLAQIKSMKSLPQKRSSGMDFCVRSFGFEFEERSRTSDGRTLEGYAAVFDTPTRIAAVGGDFDEVITHGAFTRSIRSRMPVLQFEHGRDPRVGAVPIGSIEDLAEDSRGLHVRATLFDNPVVEPVRQAIAGRAIKGMSFRFNVVKDGDAWARRSGDVDLRTVGDADVHELGPVVFPAYDSTTVSVRSLLAQLGPEEHRALLRELAYDLRSLDLEEIGVGPSARSSGDAGTNQAQAVEEPHLSIRQRLDQGALLARGILK